VGGGVDRLLINSLIIRLINQEVVIKLENYPKYSKYFQDVFFDGIPKWIHLTSSDFYSLKVFKILYLKRTTSSFNPPHIFFPVVLSFVPLSQLHPDRVYILFPLFI